MSIDLVAETLNERVTKEIRAEMARQSMSQAELGARAGWSQNYVSYRLTGKKSLTIAEIEQIARTLHVPAQQLISPGS